MSNPLFVQLAGVARGLLQAFGSEITCIHSATKTQAVGWCTEMDESQGEQLEKMGITLSEGPVLFFVPNTETDRPQVNASVVWDGNRTVKKARPYRPDGKAMCFFLVLS